MSSECSLIVVYSETNCVVALDDEDVAARLESRAVFETCAAVSEMW